MPGLVAPPRWSEDDLEQSRRQAIQAFRHARTEEPLEAYLDAFKQCQEAFKSLLDRTVDLTQISDQAIAIVTDPRLLEVLRYLAGPPISLDDLKTLADARSLSAKVLASDRALANRLVDTVMLGVDRHRFPWIHEQRDPTEEERRAAIIASAAVLASQRVATDRRNEGKTEQENQVEAALVEEGFQKVQPRTVNTSAEAPRAGEFCRESVLAGRKADLLVGLWDTRLMPIECKVSNSATNSIKRLNNDAAVKAVSWRRALGEANVVPTAVLSGVYKLRNLIDAQDRGLTLFWAHNLAQLTQWVAELHR